MLVFSLLPKMQSLGFLLKGSKPRTIILPLSLYLYIYYLFFVFCFSLFIWVILIGHLFLVHFFLRLFFKQNRIVKILLLLLHSLKEIAIHIFFIMIKTFLVYFLKQIFLARFIWVGTKFFSLVLLQEKIDGFFFRQLETDFLHLSVLLFEPLAFVLKKFQIQLKYTLHSFITKIN